MGCDVIQAEARFTNFFVVHNITRSAANHDISFGAHFVQKRIAKEDHICTLHSKSNYYA